MPERTEQAGAFVDYETGQRVSWSCNPESFVDSDSTDYARHSIPGMSGPRHQFTSGGTRTLTFQLRLHYGMERDVESAIRMLRAWLYGDYEKGKLKKGPHRLLVSFGDNWPNEKWLMTAVEVWGRLYDKNLACIAADVSVTLEEYVEESRGRREVTA